MNAQPQAGAHPNPLGINGFEFVEFAAPDPALLHALFARMGFTAVARHRSRAITLYRQGGVNFLINEEPNSFAADFAAAHGPCACGFAIRVADGAATLAAVTARGAEAVSHKADTRAVDMPVIKGIGDCMLYLVTDGVDPYAADFLFLDGVDREPAGFGLTFIDHLTHNLYFGNMAKWADYYERLFGFREIRYFDIKGAKTGLVSKAMTAPDGIVRIPLNESSDPKSQINEYLDQYHGGHLLRGDRPAHPRPRRGRRADEGAEDPDRRRPGDQAQEAAADLHRDQHRPDLLRDHPAQGQRGLRRGQLPGAVRVHRARPDAPRGALTSRRGC
jgi:4-hydroxyphenylpyruvate dioxygenase